MLSEDGANGMGWDVVLLRIRRPVGGGWSNMRVELVACTCFILFLENFLSLVLWLLPTYLPTSTTSPVHLGTFYFSGSLQLSKVPYICADDQLQVGA